MTVFRLSKAIYARDLSGRGAEIAGGRWNSKGIAMLYTANSRALCTAEIAVHTPLGIVPRDYLLVIIEVPDTLELGVIPERDLLTSWETFPHQNSTQLIGDDFIQKGTYAGLKVPSAAVQGEFNYIFNPRHPGTAKLKIKGTEPFRFDERLFIK